MAVIVNMACGLANRMFQYSYYLYLGRLGYDVRVDYYRTARLKHEDVAWDRIFPDAPLRQASAWEVFRTGGGGDWLSKVRRRLLWSTCNAKYTSAFEVYLPPREGKPVYVSGVFQNAGMVESVQAEVRKAFAFVPFMDDYNLSLVREISGCQSVAVHVRKGKDYMSRNYYIGTCPPDYYRRAVELMRSKLGHPRFYVFTDNPEWVKANFAFFDYTLVDRNPACGWGSHFDMQLMSLCRHNIISNSTYSWWGAFLNGNVDKMVVMPSVWFNPDSCDEYQSRQVACEGWMAL